MLPVTIKDTIPKLHRDSLGSSGNAFVNKFDSILTSLKSDIKRLGHLRNLEKIEPALINELGFLLAAGFKQTDTIQLKRQKLETAVRTHKIRGRFSVHVKILIDNITGLDAVIIKSIGTDDWIMTGDGTTPASFFWGTMGGDGIDNNLGLALIGAGTEIEIQGNIFINAHDGITVSTLTTAQVDQIVSELKDDIAPPYFVVHIGFINSIGIFEDYPGGVIQ